MSKMNPEEYEALIVEIRDDLFIGAMLNVPGAASFAKSKDELIERLKDAARCIEQVEEMEQANQPDVKTIFSKSFKEFGKPTIESIPCNL